MAKREQPKNVNPSLQTRGGWTKRMVENARDFIGTRTFNTIGSWLGGVAGLVAAVTGLSMWLASSTTNTHDIQSLQRERVEDQQRAENERTQDQQAQQQRDKAISDQLKTVSEKLDKVPRADQLTEIANHLSAIDGRLDADERKQNDDEQSIVKAQTQIEFIQRSSDAHLQGHQR